MLTKWALLLATVGVALAFWIDSHVDEEIRRKVELLFAEHYSDLVVSVRSAQLIPGEGIEIRGLAFVDPETSGPGAELAYLDEVFLLCDTDLQALLTGSAVVQHIVVRRPTLRVSRLSDGTWSVAKLLPLPRFSAHPPVGTVENGVVEIHDPRKSPGGTFTLRDLNLTLTPQLDQIDPASGRPTVKVAGSLTADNVRNVEIDGRFAPTGDRWQIDGTVEGLAISPELRDSLPDEASRLMAKLGNLRGQLQCGFHVAHDAKSAEPFHFRVTDGQLQRGRIDDDPRLPYPLADLHVDFRCDNNSWVIESLRARNGQMEIWLAGQGGGYTGHDPFVVELTSKRTVLDRGLVELFPRYRKLWNDFLPAGEIDVHAKVSFDGQQYRPEIRVDCRDVAFSFHKFPYRLEYATGRLEFKDDTLVTDIKAYSAGRPINIDGSVTNPGPNFVGRLNIRGDNLPLDEKLFAAFREPARQVVRDLNSAGTVNVDMTVWQEPEDARPHRHVEVTLNDCSLRAKHFPYPLGNVRGLMVLDDDVWTFNRLEGHNDSGVVTCRGRFGPTDRGREFALTFNGKNVPLEDELRDALKPSMRQMWMKLRPRGAIDLLIEFRYWPQQRESDVWVRADVPGPETSGTLLSVEPRFFPYKLDDIRGRFIYHRGRVDLQDVRAVHGNTTLSTNGYFDAETDGSWHLRFADLKVDRLRPDREFIVALPPRLSQAVAALQPTGQFSIDGQLDFFGNARPDIPVKSRWDLAFDLQRANLNCGIPLENIHGGFHVVGGFDGRKLTSRGELKIDSVTFRKVQLTDVLGPFWIDDNRLLLGKWAATGNTAPRRVSASFYGGAILGDGWIATGAEPRYAAELTVSDADLSRLAREGFGARQKLSGKVLADVNLYGDGRGIHNLGGYGQVRLREANIYELPVMVQLLSILSLKTPDDTAFTSSEIDFRIVSGRCYLEKINFKGDAVSLYGSGEMGFDKSIKMTFTPQAFRHEFPIPVFRDLVRGASQQFMVIQVDGTIDDPHVTRRFLSGVDQALQQLQADLQNPGANLRPPATPRSGQNSGGQRGWPWTLPWR